MSAAIWWTAPGAPAATKLSLSAPLADLQRVEVRDEVVEESLTGAESRTVTRTRSRITVKYGPTHNASEVRALEALVGHLDRGGTCQLAEDESQAYAAYVDSVATVDHGSAGTSMYATPWAHSGATLTAGDDIVLQGPSPKYLRERTVVGSYLSNSRIVTWSPATYFRWTYQEWMLVRHWGFWPALRRAKEDRGRNPIRHTARRHWSLELVLDEDMSLLDLIAQTPDQPLLIDSASGAPSEAELEELSRLEGGGMLGGGALGGGRWGGA